MFKKIKRRIKNRIERRIQQLWRGAMGKIVKFISGLPSFPKDWNFYHTVTLYIVGFLLYCSVIYAFYLLLPILGAIFALGIIFIMLIKLRPSAPKRDG